MRRDIVYPLFLTILAIAIAGLIYLGITGPPVRREPFGEVRVGNVKDFLVPRKIDAELRILFRYDAKGLSAMSLRCTRDLAPLEVWETESGFRFHSPYNGSEYDQDGGVLQGPAVKNLPHYRLYVDSAGISSAPDTLFVQIGRIVSPEWRLKIPAVDSFR